MIKSFNWVSSFGAWEVVASTWHLWPRFVTSESRRIEARRRMERKSHSSCCSALDRLLSFDTRNAFVYARKAAKMSGKAASWSFHWYRAQITNSEIVEGRGERIVPKNLSTLLSDVVMKPSKSFADDVTLAELVNKFSPVCLLPLVAIWIVEFIWWILNLLKWILTQTAGKSFHLPIKFPAHQLGIKSTESEQTHYEIGL